MLKWLNGSSDSSTTPPADTLSTQTPTTVGDITSPAPVPMPNRMNVAFVPAGNSVTPEVSPAQPNIPAQMPVATPPMVTPVVSVDANPVSTGISATEMTFGATPPAPEMTAAVAEAPKSENGIIEVQDGMISDIMTEALENNATPAETSSESAPSTEAWHEQQIPSSVSPQQNHSETHAGMDLPDISGDIRRLMQERWISVANTELGQISKRREEIATELGEVTESERRLSEQRRALETERATLVSQTEQWEQKLKSAESVLQKVVEDIAAL